MRKGIRHKRPRGKGERYYAGADRVRVHTTLRITVEAVCRQVCRQVCCPCVDRFSIMIRGEGLQTKGGRKLKTRKVREDRVSHVFVLALGMQCAVAL